MFLHADVRRPEGGNALTLRVRNLSAGGMMVETGEPYVRGDALRVTLRNIGEIGARVAWARDGKVGVAFDHPIDPREARRVPPKSPGADLLLVRPERGKPRRPGLKIG